MLRSSAFAVVLTCSGALVAGCGGSSTPAVPGAVAVTSGGPAKSAPAAPATGKSASAAASAPTAPSSVAPSPAPASGAPSASAATGDEAPAAAGVPLPPPGSYTYRLHGQSSSVLGDQNYDGDSTLTVDQPQDGRQHSEQRDSQGKTEQVVIARADGLHLAEIHLTQPGFDEDFKPARPVLLFPADAHKGQHWRWHMTSTDGEYTLTARLTVDELNRASVALSSVLNIKSKDVDLTIHQHDKAGRDAVILRERSVTEGTAYGTPFHSSGTRVLTKRPG